MKTALYRVGQEGSLSFQKGITATPVHVQLCNFAEWYFVTYSIYRKSRNIHIYQDFRDILIRRKKIGPKRTSICHWKSWPQPQAFDIIHQFLVPTIWNSVSCRFVSRELNSVQNCFYEKMPNEILLPNGLLSLELFEQFEAKMRNKKWRKRIFRSRQDKNWT